MVAGPIVGKAIGGPEDSCLCTDDVVPDPWWTSLRCSLSQSMEGEAQETKRSFPLPRGGFISLLVLHYWCASSETKVGRGKSGWSLFSPRHFGGPCQDKKKKKTFSSLCYIIWPWINWVELKYFSIPRLYPVSGGICKRSSNCENISAPETFGSWSWAF